MRVAHVACQIEPLRRRERAGVPDERRFCGRWGWSSGSLLAKSRAESRDFAEKVLNDLFPVNSLFLYMSFVKSRNPCGFSAHVEKKSLLFSLLSEIRALTTLQTVPGFE